MANTVNINISYWTEVNFLLKNTTSRIINPLLGDDAKDITVIVNYLFICNTIALFGIASNVTNLIIFSKQGYDITMNISLTGIAVSDLCTLLFLIWSNICLSSSFQKSETVAVSSEVQYLTAGWPHCLFTRITCTITVFITIERCLCVVIPLKIKEFITKKRTVVIVVSLFLVQMMTSVPAYQANYIDWKFFPEKNRSLLGMYRRENWQLVEGVSFVLQAIMQGLSFALLVFFTVFLLATFKRQAKWRITSTNYDKKETISNRDKKLVRMVILIAGILIFCLTPGMICFCGMAFEPEYTIGGIYDNVFYVSWSFAFICQAFNASINISVYYNMSSNYCKTFHQMFYNCKNQICIKRNR